MIVDRDGQQRGVVTAPFVNSVPPPAPGPNHWRVFGMTAIVPSRLWSSVTMKRTLGAAQDAGGATAVAAITAARTPSPTSRPRLMLRNRPLTPARLYQWVVPGLSAPALALA